MKDREATAALAVAVLDGVTELYARPLFPDSGPAVDLNVDLARRVAVRPPLWLEQSPLDMLLGLQHLALDPGRVLELAYYAGLDWTRFDVRHVRTGRDALEMANAALEEHGDRLKLLEIATATFAGDEALQREFDMPASERAVQQLLDDVSDLASNTRPGAEYRHDEGRLVPVHRSQDLFALAAVELLERAADRVTFSLCGACRRPFAPVGRSDEVYCRRTFPGHDYGVGDRLCRDIGPQRRFAEQQDELGAAYRRNYKRIDARARRGAFGRTMVDAWRFRAKEQLKRARAAGWTVAKYENELGTIEPQGKDGL